MLELILIGTGISMGINALVGALFPGQTNVTLCEKVNEEQFVCRDVSEEELVEMRGFIITEKINGQDENDGT